ncbi:MULTISPECIES: HigA family addiction module antitoxin [unclassified Snodgrassella]|uniref:HigA family addiction module antitoxin n=1 Tax=unclassified Snodgrassella TaxID=2625236 RepID=UPI0018DB96A7|nr:MULTISPECIES: HigA family addiction module antitoxin [unclassified Snodgrassella]MBI0159403.1 HigA family addiction module antidote protein [Snodgrassella sp. W6238H11]MBI0161429.1 HigA family addiction module antidote protein [Snodgrassella sp. W6238H14]
MSIHNPCHAGEVLKEYLGETSISTAAKHLGIKRPALSRIINGKAGISTDMAVRLSILLNTSPQFWINLQVNYDLWIASQKSYADVVPLNTVLST